MEKIKIENLAFKYPSGSFCALSGINLSISKGEFITLCGKSGCGKTTLLRLCKPPIAPHGKTEGRILFDGRELSSLSSREQTSQIGFVMQNPDSQIVTDKVWHELAFGLESLGLSTPQIKARVSEMASYFGIEAWFYKKVSELSGGQKQLLNLTSVMAMQPSVLILDEPTAQLDPIAAHEFIKALEKINKDLGTTIILAEHRLEEVFPVSDRIIVMDSGKIIADAPPESVSKLLKGSAHDIYISLPAPVRIFEAVDDDGPSPVTIREGRIWLEDFAKKNPISTIPDKELICKKAATAVELKEVFFKYEENSADILKALSLKAMKGELLAIVGGNGAGKTTLLSLIGGLNTPHRGKVLVNGRPLSDIPDLYSGVIGFLPQNPQTLFSEKTVFLDLLSMLEGHQIPNDEKNERINAVASLCRIDTLLNRHPYDLSGGEQQRTALAKVLLTSPEILLLDEPTKGMDSHFKEIFADILAALKEKGTTIVMVSHDIEFCAEYADRCALLFDGSVASEGTPRRFFASNSFYTTSASKMARNIIPNAILADDVIKACNGNIRERESAPLAVLSPRTPQKQQKQKEKRRISPLRIACGIVFALLFVITYTLGNGAYTDWRNHIFELIIFAEISACLALFIPRGRPIKIAKTTLSQKTSIPSAIVTATTLLAIFLTLFAGIFWFGDRRYYFISIMIIAEIFALFFGLFEGRKPKSRELVIIALLCAIGVAGRGVFYMLPQFKPVIAIVIIAGICFGGEAGFLVGAVTGFVSNFFFGQGPWTPWQMVGFGLIGLLAGLFFKKGFLRPTKIILCIFGAITTVLIYGGLTNASMVIMYQANPNLQMFIASFAAGLPFDLMHAVSTVFFLWFMAEPMTEKLERIKIKYGIAD